MSLSQLLEDAAQLRHFGAAFRCCDAIILLNAQGQPAKASEHVERIVFCPSTRFVETRDGVICEACWTPKKG